jgi:hypothetical protein
MAMQIVEVGLELVDLPAGTLAFQNQNNVPLFFAFGDDSAFFVCEHNDIVKPPQGVTTKVKFKSLNSHYGQNKDKLEVVC